MSLIPRIICGGVSSIFNCGITAIFWDIVSKKLIIPRLTVLTIIITRHLQVELLAVASNATSVLVSYGTPWSHLSFTSIFEMRTSVLSFLSKKFGSFNLLLFLSSPIINIIFGPRVSIDAAPRLRYLSRCASHLLSWHRPSWLSILLRDPGF